MPETIDWPLHGKPGQPGRRILLFFVVLVVLIALAGRAAISYWVNLLWFRSLGYGSVFWTTLRLEWSVFAAFAVVTFLVLYGAFYALKRVHAGDLPAKHTIFVAGQPVELPVESLLRYAAIGVSLLIALATGAAMESQWPTLALFRYAPHATGSVTDPVFGLPLNFYLFTLPAWQIIAGWLLTLAVLACILAALFLLVAGGAQMLTGGLSSTVPLPLRGVSVTAGFLLFALAIHVYIGRFNLLLGHHTIFDGVNYADAHVNLTGLLFVAAALLVGAVIAIAGGLLGKSGRWLAAAIVPAAVCYAIVGAAGWYVSTFVVNPNQLDRERPYIANNIRMTRLSYGLDQFSRFEFPAETTPDAADPSNNQATLDNIRLWDVQALQDTLRQVQEIRTYYDFPNIDIDRYEIGGELREVMLAARELDQGKLPASSSNWINDKLIYTHGYGVTMNPVNGFTPEGLPTFYLSNMPVQSTVPELKVTRPEIYFGEMAGTDVYVKTHQQEFNYPEGQANNLSSYEGTGGIAMGGFLRRALIAFGRGDIAKVPFSDDITPQSRLLMRRDVRARVSALAPFLTFDSDPYIVVGGDGRLYWIIDAFTSSDTYPYSTHTGLGDGSVNYMRNSVKAVIDAYNGTVTFYVFDHEDPIIAAWREIYPGMFKDESAMPAWLRAHVRYPKLLLSLQAEVYGLYHMTDPETFYNREDQWTVATETGLGEDGAQVSQPMEPNFVLMKLPGASSQEFVEILPFTPLNRNNLIGWIAARSDGAHYGTAVVYDFPKTKLVDGPQQIEARIDQNAAISGQLTLWNQQGSHVLRGNLLVIPCGKALLYAEPIYLQAAQSPMPELRLVVLALQDKLAYAPDFQTALASLFGSGTSSLTETEASSQAQAAPSPTGTPQPAGKGQFNALIAQAGRDFADYQRLTSEGKLADAGQKLDDLKTVLGKLGAQTQ
jgi:uncharacterized membrane protein (UPF0182 family)